MLIVKVKNSSNDTVAYYGGYNSIPSSYPPPSADEEPMYDNEDSNKYFRALDTNVYNSAILSYDGSNYISILFQNTKNIRGYYNDSAWTVVQAFTNSGSEYSVGSWSTFYVGGMTIIAASGFTAGSVLDSELPTFTDPQEYMNYITNPYVPPVQTYISNGGGATHIAKVTGQLKDLSSNLSDILIVSGGGGGGMLIGDTAYPGADAGGISGSGDNSADQNTGNAFGLGESGTSVSGGGGGLYGGYKGVIS